MSGELIPLEMIRAALPGDLVVLGLKQRFSRWALALAPIPDPPSYDRMRKRRRSITNWIHQNHVNKPLLIREVQAHFDGPFASVKVWTPYGDAWITVWCAE